MKPLSVEETQALIVKASELNAAGQNREAVLILRRDEDRLHSSGKAQALLEILKGAEALDDQDLAKETAKLIAKDNPDSPAVQAYR